MPNAAPQSFSLPIARRQNFTSGTFSVPANDWTEIEFIITGTEWNATPGHTCDADLERSFDGGVTWIGAGGFFGAVSPTTDRQGNPRNPGFLASWDGQACLVRGVVTMDSAFRWGFDITAR